MWTYAAGVYHLNRNYESFNGDSTKKELEVEREHVHVFYRENGNTILDMIKDIVNNYKVKPKITTDKYERKILSSCKYQIVDNNASGFHN